MKLLKACTDFYCCQLQCLRGLWKVSLFYKWLKNLLLITSYILFTFSWLNVCSWYLGIAFLLFCFSAYSTLNVYAQTCIYRGLFSGQRISMLEKTRIKKKKKRSFVHLWRSWRRSNYKSMLNSVPMSANISARGDNRPWGHWFDSG